MARFTWEWDYPAGVGKNHAMSKELLKASIRDCVIAQFASNVSGFGKKKGETVTITKVKNLAIPTTAVLSENTRIPIDTLQMATSAITVEALGRAIEYTSLADELSEFDLLQPIQKALKDQMAIIMDNLAAAALDTAYVCAIPTSLTAITWDTDGTASTSATQNLTIAHLGVIRDCLCSPLIPSCGIA